MIIDASLRSLIESTYREQINTGDYPADLKKFLLTHERRLKFFGNLMREFSNPKIVKTLKRDQIVMMIRSTTNVFVLAAKKRADELNMSKIEQMRLKMEESHKAEMNSVVDAMENAEKENVTQDKAGNETTKTQVHYDERFV